MENRQIEILVCNDDDITAAGIHSLVSVMLEFGNVTVVAPDSPQSGMGHAISVGKPLRLTKAHVGYGTKTIENIEAYSCSGTPVDCVKLATGVLLKHKPDLLVSGINHGNNASISVLYSGTMSAAVEGAIENIPSIGFSLDDYSPEADFTAAQHIVRTVVKNALQFGIPPYTALNVNIPKLPLDQIHGLKICRQAQGRYVEEFDRRVDPHGREYYWLTGRFQLEEEGEDTDIWALNNGYASIVPVQIDSTAHHLLPQLNRWKLNPVL